MLFGILAHAQKAELERYCFSCDHMLMGILTDPELGAMLPCRSKYCPHEVKRLLYGKISTGEEVTLRRLGE